MYSVPLVQATVDLQAVSPYRNRINRQQRSQEAAMKYIMFEDFSGAAIPIIFPNRIDHAEMREQMPYTRALSAGYVSYGPEGWSCHGSSKSLELKAEEADAAVIAAKFEDAES